MHTFIAALAGLSLTSGVGAPLITNQVQDSNVSLTTTPLKSTRVPINGAQKIFVREGFKILENTFAVENWGPKDSGRIIFVDGGLRTTVGWGTERWYYSWDQIAIDGDGGGSPVLINDDHSSGLARAYSSLTYDFRQVSGIYYKLSFYLDVSSTLSFSDCWAELTIGNAIVISD